MPPTRFCRSARRTALLPLGREPWKLESVSKPATALVRRKNKPFRGLGLVPPTTVGRKTQQTPCTRVRPGAIASGCPRPPKSGTPRRSFVKELIRYLIQNMYLDFQGDISLETVRNLLREDES